MKKISCRHSIMMEIIVISLIMIICEIFAKDYNDELFNDYEVVCSIFTDDILSNDSSANQNYTDKIEEEDIDKTSKPVHTEQPDKTKTPRETIQPTISSKPSTTNVPTATPEPTEVPSVTLRPSSNIKPSNGEDNRVSIVAVGDFLAHTPVINSGKSGGTYNYDHIFENLKDDFEAADIAVINMETTMGGSEFGYTTYPKFNSPQEIGISMVNTGFDVVLHATNHTMDKGDAAVVGTLNFWKQYEGQVTVLGIHESEEDSKNIQVIEKNGLKIAMLNYTYGLNGNPMDSDKKWRVDLLSNKEKIADDIKRARELADVVIVFPHWGTEYQHTISDSQSTWTEFFLDNQVDVVVGAHPHVIQPVEWKEKYIDGEKHKMLVYYSLGNFVSYQLEAARMLGGLAQFEIYKDDDGQISIENALIEPTVTHFHSPAVGSNLTVYKLSNYTQDLANIHSVNKHQTEGPLTLDCLINLSKEVLGSWY